MIVLTHWVDHDGDGLVRHDGAQVGAVEDLGHAVPAGVLEPDLLGREGDARGRAGRAAVHHGHGRGVVALERRHHRLHEDVKPTVLGTQ